jgi:REP element-mobilizing transposase RayT
MKNLKNNRLPYYDYQADGYYFVTIVSRHRRNIFTGREKMIAQEFRDVIRHTTGVSLDSLIVMSNHVHAIVTLHGASLPLGEIIRRFKAKVTRGFNQTGVYVWQPNYYEHIIRTEAALGQIRAYISMNPETELDKFDQFYK